MLYVALTFWLLVVVLTAWGVHRLWSGLIKSKVLNAVLLPGTLVAQLGHVLGLLVTGATVSNTTLYKDDESGDPENTPDPQPRIPLVGPVVIGMLPLLACGMAIYVAALRIGRPILDGVSTTIGPTVPTTLSGFWQALRDQVTLVESLVTAVMQADRSSWQIWIFVYLLVCLTIRIAPFPGFLRGALAAIIILGIGGAILSRFFDVADPRVQSGWDVLNLTVATLLFLLLASLLVRGAVGLVQVLRENT